MLFQEWETINKRTCEQLENILLHDLAPSLFFRELFHCGNLDALFPELAILAKVEQRKSHHPEGNVFEHTMQSIAAAAQFSFLNLKEKRIVMLSVLCHDYGKAKSLREGGDMMGHDVAGVPLAKKFLHRFLYDQSIITLVCKLVLYHKKPAVIFTDDPNNNGYDCLKKLCADTSELRLLLWLFWADIRGRNGVAEQFREVDGKLQNFINKTRGTRDITNM